MAIERSVAVDEVAARQHGLVTSAQAVECLGLSRKNRWVAEGRLTSVQPRVFRVLGAPETWHQAIHAAALSTGGIVSHRSAAELWGLIQPAGHIEVSLASAGGRSLRPPAVAHHVKDLRPGLAAEREGLTLTDPIRTVIDLGLVTPLWTVHQAISRGLSTKLFRLADVSGLRDALGRPGRNGTGIVRHILDGNLIAFGREESELERRFGALARRHGLPPLAVQHQVWALGRFVARIDAAYPDLKLGIEVDGFEHHASPEAFQHDRTRQNRLVALGWTVLRFTWNDVVHNPAMVASTIRQAIDRLTSVVS